ncbi:MAG: hypothetical protein DRN81_05985, partial [Thermoproteota archaeon]
EAADYLNEQKRGELRAKGVRTTQRILERMGTVNVGDTLGDFILEDIDGNLHRLSELLTQKCVIAFIKPDCEGCLMELETIGRTITDGADHRHFIFISSANPLHMVELRENFGIRCPILFDEGRDVALRLKVQTYPFNFVVNHERVILDVRAGGMSGEDYQEIVAANKE